MKHRMRLIFILIMLGIASCSLQNSGIEIKDAWARPGIEGGNTAIYVKITNQEEDDVWLEADSTIATRIELHRSAMQEDGIMKMERQGNIPLPGGEMVILEAGGLHVMLIDLKHTLEPGDSISLTLIFQEHKRIHIDVPVRNP